MTDRIVVTHYRYKRPPPPKPPAADERSRKRPVTRMCLWTMQNGLR
jgi:hypothetical protein